MQTAVDKAQHPRQNPGERALHTPKPPAGPGPNQTSVSRLQRTIGNRATARLLRKNSSEQQQADPGEGSPSTDLPAEQRGTQAGSLDRLSDMELLVITRGCLAEAVERVPAFADELARRKQKNPAFWKDRIERDAIAVEITGILEDKYRLYEGLVTTGQHAMAETLYKQYFRFITEPMELRSRPAEKLRFLLTLAQALPHNTSEWIAMHGPFPPKDTRDATAIDIEAIVERLPESDLEQAIAFYDNLKSWIESPEDQIAKRMKEQFPELGELEDMVKKTAGKALKKPKEKIKKIKAVDVLLKLAPFVEFLRAISTMENLPKKEYYGLFLSDMKTAMSAWNYTNRGGNRVIIRNGALFRVNFSPETRENFGEADYEPLHSAEALSFGSDRLSFTPGEFFTLPAELQAGLGIMLGENRAAQDFTGQPGQTRMRIITGQITALITGLWELVAGVIPLIGKAKAILDSINAVSAQAEDLINIIPRQD